MPPTYAYTSSLCSPRSSPHLLHSAHCSGRLTVWLYLSLRPPVGFRSWKKWGNSEGQAPSLQLCLKTTFVSWSKITDPLLVAWSTLPRVFPMLTPLSFRVATASLLWSQVTTLPLRHLPYQWSPTLPLLKIPRSPLKYQFMGSPEGNGTLLQYSCLENPVDGGAW